MDVSAALLTHLRDLTTSLVANPLPGDETGSEPDLEQSVRHLAAGLTRAIPSYRGLQLTLTHNQFPVVLTALTTDPDGPGAAGPGLTSLRLPLALLDSGFEPDSRIVFYAGTPGALVDLAADLAYAIENPQGQPGILLDTDLPTGGLRSGLTGVAELSTVNRAVGRLIDTGHHPDEVHATLRRQAAAAGLAPHALASRYLQC